MLKLRTGPLHYLTLSGEGYLTYSDDAMYTCHHHDSIFLCRINVVSDGLIRWVLPWISFENFFCNHAMTGAAPVLSVAI